MNYQHFRPALIGRFLKIKITLINSEGAALRFKLNNNNNKIKYQSIKVHNQFFFKTNKINIKTFI